MKKETRSTLGKVVSILIGVVYVILGFLMIQYPITTLLTLSLVMGWIVTLSGISTIIYSLKFKEVTGIQNGRIVDGILLLILGLMFLFSDYINNTLILSYLLIFWVITDSALQIQLMSFIPKSGLTIFLIIMDILIILYGIYMLFNPGIAESFLVFYVGFGFVSTGFTKFFKAFIY